MTPQESGQSESGRALATWRRHVADRATECRDIPSTKQALVLPLLAELGYDVFDPFVLRMDSSGSNTDTDLLDPDARVDYVIRRSGVPAILVACHAEADAAAAADARERVARCLRQSPAQLGIATDGRTWEWGAQERGPRGALRWFHRTSASHESRDDAGVVAVYSRSGWDVEGALRMALVRELEQDVRRILVDQLREAGDELAGLVARKLEARTKGARRREVVRVAMARTMKGVLEEVLADWRARDSETETASRPRPTPVLLVIGPEKAWHSGQDGMNQNQCLRQALDELAAAPAAKSVFAADRRMRPADEGTATGRNEWHGAGHGLTLTRRIDQKASLINDLAKELGVALEAHVVAEAGEAERRMPGAAE